MGTLRGRNRYRGRKKWKTKVHTLGALSGHLVNGVFGTLAVGLFAQDGLTGAATGNGLFFGGGAKLLLAQLAGVAATAVCVFAVAGAAWLVLQKTMGIRVSLQEEIEGLDIGEHGNSAYPEFLVRKPVYSFAGIEGTGRVETGVNVGAGGCE